MDTLTGVAEQLQPPGNKEDNLSKREESFTLVYDSPDGRCEDVILSRILDSDERFEVARISSTLARPVVFDQMPASQQARLWAIAWCAKQLRDVPNWLDKWILLDDSLLFQLFEVLQDHEQRFFRSGGGAGTADASASRVDISPVNATIASSKQTRTRQK